MEVKWKKRGYKEEDEKREGKVTINWRGTMERNRSERKKREQHTSHKLTIPHSTINTLYTQVSGLSGMVD